MSSVPPQLTLSVDPRPVAQKVRAEMRAVDPLAPEQASYLVDQWTSIARGFEWGLLADPTVPPTKVSGKLVGHSAVAANALSVELDVTGAGPAGWKVVLQLMQALSEVSIPLTSVSIASVPPARPSNVVAMLAGPYAPVRPSPFPVNRDQDGDAQRNRQIVLEFVGRVDGAKRAAVEEAFASWFDLVNGGFPPAGAVPSDNACDATEVVWVDDARAECSIPNYLGDEAAFDAVVNMAVVLDAKVVRVAALELR